MPEQPKSLYQRLAGTTRSPPSSMICCRGFIRIRRSGGSGPVPAASTRTTANANWRLILSSQPPADGRYTWDAS